MPSFTIRAALPADQKALEAIQWQASLHNPGDREALLAHPSAAELPLALIESGSVFVAEGSLSMVGFAAMVVRGDGDIELDALFVEPTQWRQGVGRALVAHCCDAAHARGARILHVVGNPHAQDFYVACGFQHIGLQQMQFGVGLVMQRCLP